MSANRILQSKGSAVFTIAPDATVRDALAMLADNNVGALVVTKDGAAPVGVISERDMVRSLNRLGDAAFATRVADLMTTDVVTCALSDSENDMLSVMTKRRVRHLPVVEDGRMVGLVSIGDVVKLRLDDLIAETEAMRDYISH